MAPPITGYKIYRSTSSGTETLLSTLGVVTSYDDTTVVNGTTYWYQVTASERPRRRAPLHREIRHTDDGARDTDTRPRPPGNATVHLSWTTPANGGSAITGYKIYRSTTSGTETLLSTLGVVTTYDDNTAVNGTTYWYQVTAVNVPGEGPRSTEKSATPTTVPGTPTLTATAGNATVHLSWTTPANGGSAITGYKIYRSTTSGTETLLSTLGVVTTYDDNTAVNGTTYWYQVTAVNVPGEGPRSTEKSAHTDGSAEHVLPVGAGAGVRYPLREWRAAGAARS